VAEDLVAAGPGTDADPCGNVITNRAEGSEQKDNEATLVPLRLLIVSFSFTPRVVPTALRWTAISEWLAANGHEVDVVTRPMPGRPAIERRPNLCIYRVGSAGLSSLRKRFRDDPSASLRNPEAASTGNEGWFGRAVRRSVQFAYRKIWTRFYWPDSEMLGILAVRRAVRRLVRRRGYDAVISVSLPFSTHLSVLGIAGRGRGTVWLQDLSDPFSFTEDTPLNNTALYRRLNYFAERRTFGAANGITVHNASQATIYGELFPEARGRISTSDFVVSLEGGAAPQQVRRVDPVLVYAGSLFASIRSPRRLLRLFAALLHRPGMERAQLHFYGEVGDCAGFFDQYRELIGERILLHGTQPREAVYRQIRRSDVLVNIGNTTQYRIPSKLLEYMLTGKPVLNLVLTDDDAAVRYMEDYPAVLHLTAEETEEGSVDRFVDFLRTVSPVSEAWTVRRAERSSVASIANGYLDLVRRMAQHQMTSTQ
jgi:glycosyltransferase involved in cell wall biosynthesis